MKLTSPMLPTTIEIQNETATVLVIENKALFLRLLQTIYDSVSGTDADVIFSQDNSILKTSTSVELITSMIPFELNEKRLMTKITQLLEQESLNEANYHHTMSLLSEIEKYMDELATHLPCSVEFKGLTPAGLIKAGGVSIVDDSTSLLERIYNYMSLVRDLIGDRLFIFSNLHSYFGADDLQLFIDTSNAHNYTILLVESSDCGIIEGVQKTIIDKDLCVI